MDIRMEAIKRAIAPPVGHRPKRVVSGSLLLLCAAFLAAYLVVAVFFDRTFVDPTPEGREVVHLIGPFQHYRLASVVQPRGLVAEADDPAIEGDRTSRVVIYENGRPLGPGHTSYHDINELGGGRFSHQPSGIIFSSSDGTDPGTNGRSYWAVVPPGPPRPTGEEVVRLIGPFERYGLASVAVPRKLAAEADNPTIEGDHTSRVVVYENDRPLGPGHATFRDIDELGGGRFSHLPNGITFSTSDGTDPNTNGRDYWAVVP
jgi:hypothetical protein